MIIVTLDEAPVRIVGRRLRDVIRALRATSWGGPAANEKQWMREVAQRANVSTGCRVRATSEAVFVNDLVKAGLLKKEG